MGGARLGNATIVCSLCTMNNKKAFEKGEMRQAGEKWDKTMAEVGQMRPSGFAVKAAPDSVVADPEAPQKIQKGHMGWCQFI